MKRTFGSLLILVALALSQSIALGQAQFVARITGDQEVPSVVTSGAGSASFTLTGAGLQYFITVDGLSGAITAAHIHSGLPGTNGGVVKTLTFSGNSASGLWTSSDTEPLTPALLADLLNGKLYFNVHTAANPGGEARGQIEVFGGTHFTAVFTGAQENPPVASGAAGTGTAVLTESGLQYKITVTGLAGPLISAHVHSGEIGVNGGVIQDITSSFTGNTATGFIPRSSFTAGQLRDLAAGRLYMNVHTTVNPGGEIRGQLLLAGGFGFSGQMDASQEVPPNGSAAKGTASFTLSAAGLQYDITVGGLTGAITAAHFHDAAAGSNGPVVRDITADFAGSTTASGIWRFDDTQPLTDALISDLLAGNLYVNVHTAANPGGEIRAQVNVNDATLATTFTAKLTGAQEEPSVTTTGRGTGTFALGAGGLAYRITVDGLSSAIVAAHFHGPAGIGTNGGVLQAVAFAGNTATGTWAIGAADITNLLLGNVYVNVHTTNNPGGEIRGQILPGSGTDLDARLTAAQETPPNASTGTGTGSFRLTREGLVFQFTADGLTGAVLSAHFHGAQRGDPGAPVRPISGGELTGTNGAGVWKPSDPSPLTVSLVGELLRERVYLNLHTAANPGGEIRGQVALAGGRPKYASLLGGAEVPPTGSNGRGVLAASLTDQGFVFRTTVSGLSGTFTAAHFHNAPGGTNGPVVRDLATDFTGLTGDGAWLPTDAQPLTNALIRQIVAGNIYENVHTTVFPGGEIRGYLTEQTTTGIGEPVARNDGLRLSNLPNPVRGETSLLFDLPGAGPVRLRLYDVAGREVARILDGNAAAGPNRVPFDASRLGAGVYLYRLEAGGRTGSGKMLVVR